MTPNFSRIAAAFAGLAILLAVPACSSKDEPEPVETENPTLKYPAPKNEGFHRIGYAPYYSNLDAIPEASLKRLDIVCFAFASIKADYTAALSGNSTGLKNLVSRCHKLGVKVMLSFNGSNDTFTSMCELRANRKVFITSLLNLVQQYDLDGIDNDWEYPNANKTSAAGNVKLMKELSNELHNPSVNKLLTMAITSGKYVGGYSKAIVQDKSLWDCVDWFNAMTYDDFSTTVEGRAHSTLDFMKTSYKYYVTTNGMPAYKYLGGIACYGRPSGITQSGNVLTYKKIISQGGDPDLDEAIVTSSSHPEPYTIYYNGKKTAAAKVAYMKEMKTGGYFFWEITQDTYDDNSLVKAAYEEYQK